MGIKFNMESNLKKNIKNKDNENICNLNKNEKDIKFDLKPILFIILLISLATLGTYYISNIINFIK